MTTYCPLCGNPLGEGESFSLKWHEQKQWWVFNHVTDDGDPAKGCGVADIRRSLPAPQSLDIPGKELGLSVVRSPS